MNFQPLGARVGQSQRLKVQGSCSIGLAAKAGLEGRPDEHIVWLAEGTTQGLPLAQPGAIPRNGQVGDALDVKLPPAGKPIAHGLGKL